MDPGYMEIDEKIYQIVHDNAWSVECMAGHDAEGRSLEYIGSRISPNDYVFDYFKDDSGCYWYQTRKGIRNEGILDMETIIFGPAEIRKTDLQGRKKKRWSKEFSLSSTSVPDTSEEEYSDTAVY